VYVRRLQHPLLAHLVGDEPGRTHAQHQPRDLKGADVEGGVGDLGDMTRQNRQTEECPDARQNNHNELDHLTFSLVWC